MLQVTLCLLCMICTVRSAAVAQDVPEKPNVIIIFTDDQGYEDVGVYGADGFDTPNLDRMAQQGLKMNSFYVSASICTPSRAGLLTGSYQTRINMSKVLFPDDSKGLHPEEVTIADVMKQRGYATAAIGKWHLGHKEPFLPINQGFDWYYGIPYSNDMWHDPAMSVADSANFRKGTSLESFRNGKKNGVPLMRNEKVVEFPAHQDTLTRRYTKEAIKFIRHNQDQPFFLYLPHAMPHVPLNTTDPFRGKTKRGLYGDVMREIDWSTGQILRTLNELNIAEDTLVLFTSDNGPWLSKGDAGGSADPLRGGKFSVWEGGMRMPAIFWWPGQIPAGVESDEIVSTIDLLPTLAELTGAELPSDWIIDGKDVSDFLLQPESVDSPRDVFYYYNRNKLKAIRAGKWKLLLQKNKLYNLKEDISESNNVIDDHPKVENKLRSMAKDFNKSLRNNERPAARAKSNKSTFSLKPGETRGGDKSPPIDNRAFTIEAALDHQSEEGVIIAQGGTVVGYTLFVKEGKLHFGIRKDRTYSGISSSKPLPPGKIKLQLKLSKKGMVSVNVNGKPFMSGSLSLVPNMPHEGVGAGLDANGNAGPYKGDFPYGGTLKEVRIHLPNIPDKAYVDIR